jgi:hypothetical protein
MFMDGYEYKEIVYDDVFVSINTVHKGFVLIDSRRLWHRIYQCVEGDVVVRIDQNKYGIEHGPEIYFNYGK